MSAATSIDLALSSPIDRTAFFRYLVWREGLGLLLLTVWVAGVADVWATDARSFRKGPKRTWQVIVAIPIVGLVAWVLIGRPRGRRRGRSAAGARGAPPRVGGSHLSVVPTLNQKEELNAQLARSEELNRQLEAWERAQRGKPNSMQAPSSPTRAGGVPPNDASSPGDEPAAPVSDEAGDTPVSPEPAASSATPPPDPRHADLSAWEADLQRWEQELKQQDAED